MKGGKRSRRPPPHFSPLPFLPSGPVQVFPARRGDRGRALGEYLASECVTCHQKSGKVVGGVPAIIGWPEDQFLAVMHAY